MTSSNENDTKKTEAPNLEDFKGVLAWVQGKKEESQAKGEPWGWVMTLVAAIVVFFALAYASYTAWKKSKEIAELRHKVDVYEEEKKQEEANLKVTALSTDISKHIAKAVRLSNLVYESKLKIKALEEERQKQQDKINKITSWEDVANL